MKEDAAGGWREVPKEELQNLYPSPSIIKVVTLRRMCRPTYNICLCIYKI
jgi:hypothetical protein